MTVTAAPAPAIATARAADGTNLRTLHWRAAGGAPVGVALIVHGLGEHAGRYRTVAAALTAAGLDVHGYDHRGHGGSGGRRNHVERWGVLHEDLAERVSAMRAAYPDLPLVLYGHSMGGLVACGYVLTGGDLPVPEPPMPDLLVLSAPGLDADIAAWKPPLARLLAGILPKLPVRNGLPAGGLSRDPEVGRLADADPLCTSSSTVRFGAEAFAEQARVNAALSAIDAMPVPTYVFHGTADPVVPPAASARFAELGNTTRRLHEGLRHECHHEPEHEQVLADVIGWLAGQGVAVRVTEPVAERRRATV